jgi:hypothetical protein
MIKNLLLGRLPNESAAPQGSGLESQSLLEKGENNYNVFPRVLIAVIIAI